MTRALCVVKVGGSLFQTPLGLARASAWIRVQSSDVRTVVLTGGGGWAEQVRRIDRDFGLTDRSAHDLAVQATSLTAWTFACLSDFRHFRRWRDLLGWTRRSDTPLRDRHCVLDARQFCEEIEPVVPGCRLVAGWEVTSDSIAARVACALGAELVLLKSASPAHADCQAASRAGYVDAFFPRVAAPLQMVRCVNLAQTGGPAEFRLQTALDG